MDKQIILFYHQDKLLTLINITIHTQMNRWILTGSSELLIWIDSTKLCQIYKVQNTVL